MRHFRNIKQDPNAGNHCIAIQLLRAELIRHQRLFQALPITRAVHQWFQSTSKVWLPI